MVGGADYFGRWGSHIGNAYVFGLALDVPITSRLSLEVEGSRAEYNITYSNFIHDFNQSTVGGNAKLYLLRDQLVQPFVGAGIMGVYYENMSHGPAYPYSSYNHWLGAGQLLAGADVSLTEDLALGLRTSWIIPMFNRPTTADNGRFSFPYYEEAAAINTSFYRIMGSVKVDL
jgi:hypothetical protein